MREWNSIRSHNRMIVHAGWLGALGFDTDDTTQFVYTSGPQGTWTQLVPAPGTPMNTRPLSETFARDSHAMVYDPIRQRLVVFGGYHADVPEFNVNTNLWTLPNRHSHNVLAAAAGWSFPDLQPEPGFALPDGRGSA